MEQDNEDKMVKIIEEICKGQASDAKHFNILKSIYKHISKYENEPFEQRAQSIKNIIDLEIKGA